MTSSVPLFREGRRQGAGTAGSGWDIYPPFSTDLWDPFGFDGGLTSGTPIIHANVDWQETDTAHVFKVDLPGVSKEELKVQVEEGDILQISGERVKEEEEHKDDYKWHRVERRRGKFVRRFRLPDNADMDNIKCELDNGVLNALVPKKQSTETNVRNIDIT